MVCAAPSRVFRGDFPQARNVNTSGASAADGSLNALLEERGRVGRARAEKDACASCAGQKLVICDRCDGSMRWLLEDKKTGAVLGERRCPWCNEVGMQECRACVPAFARTTGGRRGGR